MVVVVVVVCCTKVGIPNISDLAASLAASRIGCSLAAGKGERRPEPVCEGAVAPPFSSTLGCGVTERGCPIAAAVALEASKILRVVIAGGREDELLLLFEFEFEFEFVVLGPELATGLEMDRCATWLENLAVALFPLLPLLLLFPVEFRMLFARCLLRRRLSWSGTKRGACVAPWECSAAHASWCCMLNLSLSLSVSMHRGAVRQERGLPHGCLGLLQSGVL